MIIFSEVYFHNKFLENILILNKSNVSTSLPFDLLSAFENFPQSVESYHKSEKVLQLQCQLDNNGYLLTFEIQTGIE